jgi:hypothetical protein
VKHRVLLQVFAVLSAVLFLMHVMDDMVLGLDRVGPQNIIGLLILVLWLYAGLVLAERRSGLIIILLLGLLSAGVTMLHLNGARVATREFAQAPGAFRFFLVLWALGVAGLLSAIFAAQGLWSMRTAKRDV